MNLCLNETHDKDKVGVFKRGCRGCKRERIAVTYREKRGGTKNPLQKCGECGRMIAQSPSGLFQHKNNDGIWCFGVGRIY
jgi:hypothetical protein